MAEQLTGIRAVFFDAVGTVLFPQPGAPLVYASAARRHGLNLSIVDVLQRFRAAFRAEEVIDRTAGWETSEEREVVRWRRIVANTLTEIPDTAAVFRELFDHFARPTAWETGCDVGGVLATLAGRGLTLGMGSNYDARLASVVAGHPELVPLRDRVVVSSLVGFRKPAGEFFREVVRVAGVEPGEVLFVGDDFENDYVGAGAAELRPVLLDPEGRHPEVANRIESLSTLPDVLA